MKTSTTGFGKSRLNTYLDLFQYFKKNDVFARHDYQGFLQTKEILEKKLQVTASQTCILEIGCGQRFSRTLLFHSEGAQITGIDLDFVDPNFSFTGMLNIWRVNGFERFFKTFFRHILYDRRYYRIIEQEYGKPLKMSNLDVRTMSAVQLNFPNNHFDFIFSNAVIEHIKNVEDACSEISKVLKPTGFAQIGIHLYPSLSGGHCLDWAYPDEEPSKTVPPWDHLRENKFPTHVYLNKLKKEEYLSIFERHFNIQDIKLYLEGESYLTKEVFNQINGYSEEDLLTRRMKILITKKI